MRAVGNDLEALVEQALFPDLLQSPPLGLDVVVIVGDIGVVHVRPEADDAGEILPHALVLPDALLALLDEGLDAVSLDLVLALDADGLLDLQLNGQSVGVPAGLAGDLVSLHGAVARNHVLDDTGQHVADVGLAVGGRRSVIEHIQGPAFALLDALLKDVIVFPELHGRVLAVHEVQVRIYLFVHSLASFLVSFMSKRSKKCARLIIAEPCRQVRGLRPLTVAAFAVCIHSALCPIESRLSSAKWQNVCAWLIADAQNRGLALLSISYHIDTYTL